MTTRTEFQAVVEQLRDITGDPNAWMTGLSPAEVQTALLYGMGSDEPALAPILAKIRAHHPAVFGPAAADHPRQAPAQTGAAATAIKKAESDLAQQNSSTAALDLMVISAVLNAHATSTAGAETLRALQREIDDAVRTRTDLDTPAGARDFQRFLVGKLRHISRVIEEAGLDDRSKAALATAWTALYESSKRVDATPGQAAPAEAAQDKAAPVPKHNPAPAAAPAAVPLPAELPPYGADLPLAVDDPLAGLLPTAPAPAPATPAPAGPSAPVPQIPVPAPTLPAAAAMPAGGAPLGVPSGLPFPRGGTARDDGLSLADLLAAEEAALAGEPTPEADDEDAPEKDVPDPEKAAERDDAKAAPDKPESTVVKLPGGEQITAPTPALARVLTAALAGTPIGEAFQREDLPVPPPGTPVPHPVDPSRVGTGDVAMFTDRQALAIDRDRALLDGQIRPVSAISGPSFLGWLHPPAAGETAPSATTPNSSDTPAPTRPAAPAEPAR